MTLEANDILWPAEAKYLEVLIDDKIMFKNAREIRNPTRGSHPVD